MPQPLATDRSIERPMPQPLPLDFSPTGCYIAALVEAAAFSINTTLSSEDEVDFGDSDIEHEMSEAGVLARFRQIDLGKSLGIDHVTYDSEGNVQINDFPTLLEDMAQFALTTRIH